MNIITGYRGEPHITAQEDRDINLGVVGKSTSDLYVLDVGQQLDADIVSANEIRIRDGVLVMQGCAASIDYGTYDSLTISNGSQGMERIDVIAAQYERDGDTNVESVSLVVIEGTPAASDPIAPTLTGGSIQGGDTLVQMPLYYVNLDGVSIDSIDAQYKMATNLDWCTLSDATMAKWNDIAGGASNDEIMNYLSESIKIVVKTGTKTFPANTGTAIDCSSEVGTGTLVGALVSLGALQLPWFRTSTSDHRKTWVQRIDPTSITIYNTDDAWTNYDYTVVLFIKPNFS